MEMGGVCNAIIIHIEALKRVSTDDQKACIDQGERLAAQKDGSKDTG
jgi:hypothetical protein